jgi:hypothetical protein
MVEGKGKEGTRVRVDGEEAVLHLTDQSVMFEKGGKVSGFERSAIRMVKPDGEAMIIAYSSGSEVKSVRVEPITAFASLIVSGEAQTQPTSRVGLDEIFDRLYEDTRKELEERLARVEDQPENKDLRLTPEERQKYIAIRNQMTNVIGAKLVANHDGEEPLLTFWGLENRPREFQICVVKTMHIDFLLGIVSQKAETEDVGYQARQVWPEDWPRILERFSLGNELYLSDKFSKYVNYLKSHWEYHPASRRPVLVS